MQYPTLTRRLAAMFYDFLLIVAMMMVWAMIVTGLAGWLYDSSSIENTPFEYLLPLGLVAIWYLYHLYFWRKGGQTVGMKTWRIKLVNLRSEHPISVVQSQIRFVGGLLSFVGLGFGYLMVLSAHRHAWHDRISDTELHFLPKPKKA